MENIFSNPIFSKKYMTILKVHLSNEIRHIQVEEAAHQDINNYYKIMIGQKITEELSLWMKILMMI